MYVCDSLSLGIGNLHLYALLWPAESLYATNIILIPHNLQLMVILTVVMVRVRAFTDLLPYHPAVVDAISISDI